MICCSNISKHNDLMKYKYMNMKYEDINNISYNKLKTIEIVYVYDINIFIDENHIYKKKLQMLKNLEYIYIEENIADCDILKNNKLIDDFINFDKIKMCCQLFRNIPINLSITKDNKMRIITSKNFLENIDENINILHIINSQNIKFNNLHENIQHLTVNIFSIEHLFLIKFPCQLQFLNINYDSKLDVNHIQNNIKIPFNCELNLFLMYK